VDPVSPDGRRTTVLACRGNVQTATVECAPGTLPEGGARYQQQILGGQGTFVRLTSSAVAYTSNDSIFAFNVTVQNLIDLAMATSDGATRHEDGVRVFFHQEPTVTDGTGSIEVANATGVGTFTAGDQAYFQYGGAIGGVDQGELGADGILASAEVSAAKQWRLRMPASVNTFSFLVMVSTQTPEGSKASVAPQVSAVSPNPMVPGASATITGTNFSLTPANNTVTIGGRVATVTGATATQLTVTVPCVSSGNVAVQVTTGGMKGVAAAAPLQVTERTVGIGQALVLTSAAESACNELANANGAARYIVGIFNASTTPTATAPFEFSADLAGAEPAQAQAVAQTGDAVLGRPASLDRSMSLAQAQNADRLHLQLLERNREVAEKLRREIGTRAAPTGRRANHNVVVGDVPLTRQFRVSNISPPAGQTICSSFYAVNATRVYYNGKIAIYEDDATPDALKSVNNATMASNYQKIGDQFNADMEPIVRNNFSDILLRDAITDNNGVLVALFTPRINNSFSGVAGFVVSCDQYLNTDTTTSYAPGGPYTGINSTGGTANNGASNQGEFFYAYQPTVASAGYLSGNTPDSWYRSIRSTFIHESKHVASQAVRVANGFPLEQSWLEEGTARHVEELWMREAVDNVAWKGNTGFGTAANPINIYCDLRPEAAECNANPRRPSINMLRHYNPLYTFLHPGGTGQGNSRLLSPFGPSQSDNASYFYAISWSLVRYTIDRYGASDAAFLSALTQSSQTGAANLSARAGGVSIDQILGGWALAMAADDHPLLAAAPSPDIQFPTWNLRSIYAGLNTDPMASGFTLAYPSVPIAATFGSFNPAPVTTLRGGGFVTYEISGTQTAPQLLRLQGSGGAAIPSTARVAITRIQ
jgi:hypothetical protein